MDVLPGGDIALCWGLLQTFLEKMFILSKKVFGNSRMQQGWV